MLLFLSVRLAAAIHRFLYTYMPSNIAIDLLRTRRGLKWALPVALILVPAYLIASAMASAAVDRSGPDWLNVLVLVFIWDAMKFTALAIWSPVLLYRTSVERTGSVKTSLAGGVSTECRAEPHKLPVAQHQRVGEA
jgi:hypothetical protein